MGTKHLNLPLRVTVHSDDRYGIADAAGNQVLPPQHVERAVMKTLVRACNDRHTLLTALNSIAMSYPVTEEGETFADMARSAIAETLSQAE